MFYKQLLGRLIVPYW